jgi:tetratricopeptide (TPR) repeat protein
MGTLELARHQFRTALDWGQRAVANNPGRAYAYGVVADAQVELGRYEDAVQTLQKMVDLRPDMSSYSRISYIRELYGDMDGAIEMMQRAVDAGVPNSENTAWTRTQLGNLYFNLGRLSDAEREYDLTLYGYPRYGFALAGLGRVRAAQGRMDEAITLFDQASKQVPNPEFLIALGDLYQVTGQVEEAQKQHDLLGVIQKLYEANGVDMDLEIALFNADHGIDLASTTAQARRAYERRPSVYAADVLAWVLYKAGDYEEARSFSEQALRLGTKDALKLFHAGMISIRLGDKDRARDYLERAIEINPHFSILYAQEAQHTLDELRAGSSGD